MSLCWWLSPQGGWHPRVSLGVSPVTPALGSSTHLAHAEAEGLAVDRCLQVPWLRKSGLEEAFRFDQGFLGQGRSIKTIDTKGVVSPQS